LRCRIPLPKYQTINEGSQHAPQFRSNVWIDGVSYTSPHTFSNQKVDKHDVAKLALEGILKYKNRLQEYTQRFGIPLQVYQIINEGSQHAPQFRSSVQIDGVSYSSPHTFSH
jgi:dsRNA-specific ribonuclease